MIDYRRFIETVLDCQLVTTKEDKIYSLAQKIMHDPFIQSLYEPLYRTWWESRPFQDLDLLNEDPDTPDVTVDWPDFYMQVAEGLPRNDKLALRKKYTP
jgi:hypothetical protein